MSKGEGDPSPRSPGGDDDLAARITQAKSERQPKRGPSAADKYNSLSLAWRMSLELVVGVGLGAGIGYGLDELFGTRPFLLIVFLLLGFAAGVKTVMATAQSASRSSQTDPPGEARDRNDTPTG